MKRRMLKIAGLLATGVMAFGGMSLVSMAASTGTPLVGLAVYVENVQTDTTKEKEAVPYDKMVIVDLEQKEGVKPEEQYVNIRKSADAEDGEVLGKLYNHRAGEIVKEEGDWYLIKSGSVKGYVKKDLVVSGDKAAELARKYGWEVAVINAEVLNVRLEANEDAEVVDTVMESEAYSVVSDAGDWVKVQMSDGREGYVAKQYVTCEVRFDEAESLEEEQARLDGEWQAYQKAQEDARKAAEEAAKKEQEKLPVTQPEVVEPETTVPETEAPETNAPATETPETAETNTPATETTETAATEAIETETQETTAPETIAPETTVPETEAPETNVPETEAPETNAPVTEAPETAETEAPATETPATNTPETEVPDNSSSESSNSGLGTSIANYALQFVGNPYVWGGTSLTNGADCSGFVQSVMSNFGIYLARVAEDQAAGGTSVSPGSEQAGDLVFYVDESGYIYHVALCIGGGQVVHASNPTSGIIVSGMYFDTVYAIKRYI